MSDTKRLSIRHKTLTDSEVSLVCSRSNSKRCPTVVRPCALDQGASETAAAWSACPVSEWSVPTEWSVPSVRAGRAGDFGRAIFGEAGLFPDSRGPFFLAILSDASSFSAIPTCRLLSIFCLLIDQLQPLASLANSLACRAEFGRPVWNGEGEVDGEGVLLQTVLVAFLTGRSLGSILTGFCVERTMTVRCLFFFFFIFIKMARFVFW